MLIRKWGELCGDKNETHPGIPPFLREESRTEEYVIFIIKHRKHLAIWKVKPDIKCEQLGKDWRRDWVFFAQPQMAILPTKSNGSLKESHSTWSWLASLTAYKGGKIYS